MVDQGIICCLIIGVKVRVEEFHSTKVDGVWFMWKGNGNERLMSGPVDPTLTNENENL